MRIVSGKYGGRIFKPNKSFKARPTTDIAKEGLFNILQNRFDFEAKTVLDLFAGTGSIGYEFLSRGCESTTFVEKNFHHYKFILEVVQKLDIKNARAVKSDVFKYLKTCPDQYDIIFADPPFDLNRFDEVPGAVLDAGLLKVEGVFIFEHPKEFTFNDHPRFKEIRNYGKVNFSFFQ